MENRAKIASFWPIFYFTRMDSKTALFWPVFFKIKSAKMTSLWTMLF